MTGNPNRFKDTDAADAPPPATIQTIQLEPPRRRRHRDYLAHTHIFYICGPARSLRVIVSTPSSFNVSSRAFERFHSVDAFEYSRIPF